MEIIIQALQWNNYCKHCKWSLIILYIVVDNSYLKMTLLNAQDISFYPSIGKEWHFLYIFEIFHKD